MKINEIFYSIQGEGKWTGLPNIFIRTSGCNLRCSFCDTTYAYDDGKEMSIDEISSQISKYPCKYICITGGEPLLQKEILNLIDFLIKRNYKICIETNGYRRNGSVRNCANTQDGFNSLCEQITPCRISIDTLPANDRSG